MTQLLKAPILAITFGIAFGFLIALTLTAKSEVISRVVDKNIELAKFKAECFKTGRLSYDSGEKQWSCVRQEVGKDFSLENFRY